VKSVLKEKRFQDIEGIKEKATEKLKAVPFEALVV
jgi:hypothetical protein